MSFLASISPGNIKGKLPSDWKFDDDLRWIRPTEWLSLGTSTYDGTVPEKIIGLVAVYPDDVNNYVSFHLDTNDSSNISVNWGDGTTESLAHNTTHYHEYDYDSITSDTSTAKSTLFRGYKQVKFEVTLTGSAKFSQILFDVDGPFTTHTSRLYRRGANILDLFISSSNATNHEISDDRPLNICEQIEIRNTSSNRLSNPQKLYSGAQALESIPFVPYIYNSGYRDYVYAFYYCQNLTQLPDDFADPDRYWFRNPSRTQEAFRACYSLRYIPNGLFGTTTWASNSSLYYMFYDCRKLKNIPYLPMRTGAGTDTRCDYIFGNCLELRAIPQGFSVERANTNGIDRLFYGCRKCTDWSALYDGGVAILDNLNISAGSSFNMSQTFGNLDQLLEFPYVGNFSKATQEAYAVFLSNGHIKRFNSQYTHLDFSRVDGLKNLFQDCYNLQEIPEIRVRSLTRINAFYYTFYSCQNLRNIKMTGMIAGPSDGEYYRCFYNCRTLAVIDGIDFSFATETSDYYQMFHVCRDISAIKFPGTFRAGYASPRINVTVANHADISGEYHITADGTGYDQASGNGELRVAESGGNYTWTIRDSSDNTPNESSSASSSTQFTPHSADWSGATNAVTFSEVMTGFKYTVTGGSGDGLRYNPINRANMLEIFNQLVTVSHSATLDLRNNSYTADLTDADKAIATNKGWTLTLA